MRTNNINYLGCLMMKLTMKFNGLKTLVFSAALSAMAFSSVAGGGGQIVVMHEGVSYTCVYNGQDEIVSCHLTYPGFRAGVVPEEVPYHAGCRVRPSKC